MSPRLELAVIAVVAVLGSVLFVGGWVVGDASARESIAPCIEAVEQADSVVDTTTALGLAMVERAETEDWYDRSVATGNVEHLTSVLETQVPRYEALREECNR